MPQCCALLRRRSRPCRRPALALPQAGSGPATAPGGWVGHVPTALALRRLQSASTVWTQNLPWGDSPLSRQPSGTRNTQVYPPPKGPRCKRPIRPNESSAQASKEGETIANAQYFCSMLPWLRGGCNYCVGFNITKPICSYCARHPGAPLSRDLWASQQPPAWCRPELEE